MIYLRARVSIAVGVKIWSIDANGLNLIIFITEERYFGFVVPLQLPHIHNIS
jgi:hypothetical protein